MKVKMVKPEKKICPQKEKEREVECASEESDGVKRKGGVILALRSEKDNDGEEERREKRKENGFDRKYNPSPPLNMESEENNKTREGARRRGED